MPESAGEVLFLLSLAVMVYVGMGRARGRGLSSPSTAVSVTLAAALRSLPPVLLWTGYAVVTETGTEVAWMIAATPAATAIGVVTQGLRETGRDRKVAPDRARAAGGSR